jgi:hypothetical protein
MILSGELKDFSLADVLQLLLQQRKTGLLALARGKEKAELSIAQGNLAGVRVNGETPEGKVKDILVETGRVPKSELADLEAISRDMGRPLLATLVSKGHLQEEERTEWLQIITEDMVCELFGWLEGRYEFTGAAKAPASAPAAISTEFACMEGMRRIDEWPGLRGELPDARMVFRPTGKPFDGDPQGWDRTVLALVDARRNLSQIGRLVPFGSFRLSECIVNLWHGGFIAPIQAAGEERGAPVAADPQSEKDRKTALVMGAAILILMSAVAARLGAAWMSGGMGREVPAQARPNEYDYGVPRALARDNVETFLIDFAARVDSLPPSLSPLRKQGMLTRREMAAAGVRAVARRAGGLDIIQK